MAAPLVNRVEAARLLEAGGVLLMATDTLPGLHARMDRPEALARISEIKQRDPAKPLLLLAASLDAVADVATLTPRQRSYAERCWPGPYTLILPALPELPRDVTTDDDTVAVRVPGMSGLRKLLADVGVPVVSTSANRSGEVPDPTLAAATEIFRETVDGVYDPGGGAEAISTRPSALVDLTVWPPLILREGPCASPDVAGLDLPPGGF
ncbi:threonylcarbamoyl-AMP synthase [bacterium]|nr:MAG: threonylcarbamoyl-AMP synthase [bacterium]